MYRLFERSTTAAVLIHSWLGSSRPSIHPAVRPPTAFLCRFTLKTENSFIIQREKSMASVPKRVSLWTVAERTIVHSNRSFSYLECNQNLIFFSFFQLTNWGINYCWNSAEVWTMKEFIWKKYLIVFKWNVVILIKYSVKSFIYSVNRNTMHFRRSRNRKADSCLWCTRSCSNWCSSRYFHFFMLFRDSI